MMYRAFGLGQTPADFAAQQPAQSGQSAPYDPYAGTDALGGPTNGNASDTASGTSAPDCTPGTSGCVPHWYCYIPFMATPDCLQSFQEGVTEISSGATQAAVGTASAVAAGVTTGVTSGAVATATQNPFGSTLLIAAAGVILLLILKR